MIIKPVAKAEIAVWQSPTLKPSLKPTLRPTPPPTPSQTPTPTIKPKPPKPTVGISNNSLTEAVNNYRQNQGKAAMGISKELCAAAKFRAEKVGSNLDHTGYQDSLAAIPHTASAENLWWGTRVAVEAIVKAWAESPGHNQNMLGNWRVGCGEIAGSTAAFLFIK